MEKFKFNYMMLSRLESDCKYFLGYGNRNVNNLYWYDVTNHIKEMLKIYDSFPIHLRPEWLNRTEILQYHKAMING